MSMLRVGGARKTGKKEEDSESTDYLRPLIHSYKRYKVNAKLHVSNDSIAILPS